MNANIYTENELSVSEAFDKQSVLFDDLFSSGTIIQYKRERVRAHIKNLLEPHSHILELNAGTGEDGIYFAKLGHYVHETDISSGMLQILKHKINQQDLIENITYEKCSFNSLEKLRNRVPYDLIFSNFAGINCTDKLDQVLDTMMDLLKPHGKITLVFLPTFCLWEFLMMFKGNFNTAFRRFCGRKGAKAHIEGVYFKCWYYHPSHIIRKLKPAFDVIGYEGLCTIVPPSYIAHFPEKHPKLYGFSKEKENSWKGKWPWRCMGDYVILSFQKKE